MKTYNRLIIDINKEITDIVTAKQNDTLSRYLDITLVDGGVPVNLTGHEVRFYARKADGKVVYNTAQITDATKGRCQIELTSQALAVAQDLSCELTIYKDNREILSTKVFVIHVDKTLRNDEAVESSNEYGALVVLYQNLHESYLLMQDMIQKIGVPGINAQSLNLDTMYKIWDYMVQYLKDNSSAGVVSGVNAINSKIGNDGDAHTSTVMGKLNKGAVKSIQRGIVTFSDEYDTTITISDVNPQKTLVLLDNNLLFSGQSSGGVVYGAILVSLTSTSLVLKSHHHIDTSGGITGKTASYQVIEYY